MARRFLGRPLLGLLRRRPGSKGAARRRGPAHPRCDPRRTGRGRLRARPPRGEVQGARDRRHRARRRGGALPAGEVHRRLRARPRGGLRLRTARGRGRRPGVGSRRPGRPPRRPRSPRHPGCRGPGAPRGARRAPRGSRRHAALQPAHRSRPDTGRASAPRSDRGRNPVHGLDRRPRDVRHRPHARVRGRALDRDRPEDPLRGRGRGCALQRRDARAATGDRRGLRLVGRGRRGDGLCPSRRAARRSGRARASVSRRTPLPRSSPRRG